MTEKRFQWIYIKDNILELRDNGIVKIFNNERLEELLNDLAEENEQLKQTIKEAVNQIHLVHMQSMFHTVQSFKGDVSKRYRYSKENDTIYDTANHYGQYDKVLDKAEIVMLLNEYETVLNELKGDVE